jgi:hypothetical protein
MFDAGILRAGDDTFFHNQPQRYEIIMNIVSLFAIFTLFDEKRLFLTYEHV